MSPSRHRWAILSVMFYVVCACGWVGIAYPLLPGVSNLPIVVLPAAKARRCQSKWVETLGRSSVSVAKVPPPHSEPKRFMTKATIMPRSFDTRAWVSNFCDLMVRRHEMIGREKRYTQKHTHSGGKLSGWRWAWVGNLSGI